MQQCKTYTPGMFRGAAREQFMKDLKKMAKDGWHVHTITSEGLGTDRIHSGQLAVVYQK